MPKELAQVKRERYFGRPKPQAESQTTVILPNICPVVAGRSHS
jgi:hypothetical protein